MTQSQLGSSALASNLHPRWISITRGVQMIQGDTGARRGRRQCRCQNSRGKDHWSQRGRRGHHKSTRQHSTKVQQRHHKSTSQSSWRLSLAATRVASWIRKTGGGEGERVTATAVGASTASGAGSTSCTLERRLALNVNLAACLLARRLIRAFWLLMAKRPNTIILLPLCQNRGMSVRGDLNNNNNRANLTSRLTLFSNNRSSSRQWHSSTRKSKLLHE